MTTDETINCPSCNAPQLPSARYCTECNMPIQAVLDARLERKLARSLAREKRDMQRKPLPMVGGFLISLGLVIAAQPAALFGSSLCFALFLIAGFSSGGSGLGGTISILALLAIGFVVMFLIPGVLGILAGKWGVFLGLAYSIILVFITVPWEFYNLNINTYSTCLPFVPRGIEFAIIPVATAVAGASGAWINWRHKHNNKKPAVYLERPLLSCIPILVICCVCSILAAPVITYIKAPKTEVVTYPQYGLEFTKPLGWYYMRDKSSRTISDKLSSVLSDTAIRKGAIREFKLSETGPGGSDVRIYVYTAMPFTEEPLSGFSSADDVYERLRRTLDRLKEHPPSTISPDWVDYRWLGNVNVGGVKGVKICYAQSDSDSHEISEEYALHNFDIFVFKKPYLYGIKFDFDRDAPEKSRQDDYEKIVGSIQFVPVEGAEDVISKEGEIHPGQQEDVPPGKCTWTKSLDMTVSDVSALDADHVWAVGPGGVVKYFDGSTWAKQFEAEIQSPFQEGVILREGLNGISCIDQRHVWAVGEYGGVYFFNGNTWTKQKDMCDLLPDRIVGLRAVSAADQEHVWAVSGRSVYFFDGTSWSRQFSADTEYLEDIFALDANHVWAVGGHQHGGSCGDIFFFNGASWAWQHKTDAYLSSIFATFPGNAWALGGSQIHSCNGGDWHLQYDTEEDSLLAEFPRGGVAFDPSNAWVVGDQGGLYFFDGTSWKKEFEAYLVEGEFLSGLSASSPGNVWAIGGDNPSSLDGSFIYKGQVLQPE